MLSLGFTYDLLYALVARDGREKALFGDCQPLAHEAFCRSVTGEVFPEIWFELPLLGDPWFDLHALVKHEDVDSESSFAGHGGVYSKTLQWFGAQSDDVRQLALSYDVSRGIVDRPAIQLLSWRPSAVAEDFLLTACSEQAAQAYRAFLARIPHEWFACYAGVFPNRLADGTGQAPEDAPRGPEGTLEFPADALEASEDALESPWVRVECTLNSELQRACADDPALLADHMRQLGLDQLGDSLLPYCQVLADTPFELEFQFDVMADGTAGPTVSASVRFACPPGEGAWQHYDEQGPAGELMRHAQDWGLVDDRWHLLGKTTFGKRVARNGESRLLFCFPAFLKIKWRGGEPVDAKAYLTAGVQ